MSEFNISVLNLMALLIGFFVFKYLTESLYAKLIVRPNGRPPKDSWGLNAYSKEACKSHKKKWQCHLFITRTHQHIWFEYGKLHWITKMIQSFRANNVKEH